MVFRLPDDSQRIAIIGRTGSGKTQAGMWHLSTRSFTSKPWVIFDFKGDRLINNIPGRKEWDITDAPPKKPGVYIVHPNPHQADDGTVDEFLWKCLSQENIGIYLDEGYMIGTSKPFRAILTQGRSKNVPVIVLSQRPVWMTRFVWSEADFFQVFHLNSDDDIKAVQGFIPNKINISAILNGPKGNEKLKLPRYHSFYFDIGENEPSILKPVPDAETILASFKSKLVPPRRKL